MNAPDPIATPPTLRETLSVPLLGVPIVFRSNSAAVIACAAEALQVWRDLPAELVETGAPACVAIVVQPLVPDEPAAPLQGGLLMRAHGDTLLATGDGCLLSARPAAGTALAFITPELVGDPPRLRHAVLERLGLLLAGARARAPLRASAVGAGPRALLLSGADDDLIATLCYGGARSGLALLASEHIYLRDGRPPWLWGHPGVLRLPAAQAQRFPPQAGAAPLVRGGMVELAGTAKLACPASQVRVCLVERTTGQASRLEPASAAAAAAALTRLAAPESCFAQAGTPAAAARVAAGAYRLRAGSDLASAVMLLQHLLEHSAW